MSFSIAPAVRRGLLSATSSHSLTSPTARSCHVSSFYGNPSTLVSPISSSPLLVLNRSLRPSRPRYSLSSIATSKLFTSSTVMELNGEARPKRKQSPVHALERPAKHLRPETSAPTPGDATPQNGTVYNIEAEVAASRPLNALTSATDSPEWQATIERVVKSVVSIHFCQTCSFDTDLSMSSQATGFVVDAERGYILTNRHVACAGPFWGYCIFDNHEEVRQRVFSSCCICKLRFHHSVT